MKPLFIVAKYTFKEILSSKILYLVGILSVAILLATFLGSEFTYGVPEKVALDMGLGFLSLSSVGIAIFMGVGLISNEVETRTLYMIISRPISRTQFILGKCLGLSGILTINILILGLVAIVSSLIVGGSIPSLVYWAIFFGIIEAFLVLLIAVLLSLMTNKTMAVVYSLVLFTLGHALSETQTLGFAKRSPVISKALDVYGFFFPNFSKLNIKDFILYKNDLSGEFLLGATSYGLLYCLFLGVIISFLFKHKNLD